MNEIKVFAVYANTSEGGHDCEMLLKAKSEEQAIKIAKKNGCNAKNGYRYVNAKELNGVLLDSDIVIIDPWFE